MCANNLHDYYSSIINRLNHLESLESHIDYAIKRFKETDELCADRIKSFGSEFRKSIGLESTGGIFSNFVSGINSIIDKGKKAWSSISNFTAKVCHSTGIWYKEHKILLQNLGTILLEGVAAGLMIAGIIAGG